MTKANMTGTTNRNVEMKRKKILSYDTAISSFYHSTILHSMALFRAAVYLSTYLYCLLRSIFPYSYLICRHQFDSDNPQSGTTGEASRLRRAQSEQLRHRLQREHESTARRWTGV